MARPRLSLKKLLAIATSVMTLSTLTWAAPSYAKDPFRSEQPRDISDAVESAFNALFKEGDYVRGEQYLKNVKEEEPLAYALRAAISYLNDDLSAFETESAKIATAARTTLATDPLRGNLYLAVGSFFEGAAIYTKNKFTGLPAALGKLQDVFKYMDAAAAIDPHDPELSLLKGYMDMMLATNLPFSDPDDAIQRLMEHGSPKYLAYRGVAIAYRDLRKLDQALDAVNQAIQATPNNPEMFYLKAQILVKQKNYTEAVSWFDKALAKQDQLPMAVVDDISGERNRAATQVAQTP